MRREGLAKFIKILEQRILSYRFSLTSISRCGSAVFAEPDRLVWYYVRDAARTITQNTPLVVCSRRLVRTHRKETL